MSGGQFNYLQTRYEWDEAIEEIENQINENPNKYNSLTLENLKVGLEYIKTARIYLQRIDYLFSNDDGEDSFLERLLNDLEEIKKNNYL